MFSRNPSSHLPLQRSHSLLISRNARIFITGIIPYSHSSHRSGLSMHMSGANSSPVRAHQCPQRDGDGGNGRQDLGSLSGVFHSTCFPPCRLLLFFISGFGSVVHFLPFSHLLLPYRRLNRFLYSSSFAFLCYFPYISSALLLCIYLSLYRTHKVVYRLRYKLVIVYTCL